MLQVGIFIEDFWGFFGLKNPIPHLRNWGYFGDFSLEILEDSREFFDLARNENSQSPIPIKSHPKATSDYKDITDMRLTLFRKFDCVSAEFSKEIFRNFYLTLTNSMSQFHSEQGKKLSALFFRSLIAQAKIPSFP